MVAPHELRSPVCESTGFHSKYSIGSHSPKHLLESYGYRGRVAQLGEHLLCKQGVTGSIPVTSTNYLPAITTTC
jgi:hypothetical protein